METCVMITNITDPSFNGSFKVFFLLNILLTIFVLWQVYGKSASVRAATVPSAWIRLVSERAPAMLQVPNQVQNRLQGSKSGQNETSGRVLQGIRKKRGRKQLYTDLFHRVFARQLHSTGNLSMRNRIWRPQLWY